MNLCLKEAHLEKERYQIINIKINSLFLKKQAFFFFFFLWYHGNDRISDLKMSNKKAIITSVLVAVLVVGTLTATYAYFQARIGTGSTTNTTVTAKTIDGLTFNQGTNLSITATQTNFASGKGNLSSSTSPTVTLKARNDAAASYNYKACLNITENTFIHSQISSTETNSGRTVNLFDYKTFYSDTSKFTINDEVISGSSVYFNRAHFQIPEGLVGKTLTFSADLKKEGNITRLFVYGIINGSATRGKEVTATDEFVKSSITFTPTSTSDYIHITFGDGSGKIYAKNIQLEVGDSITPYDQYGYIENADLELTVTKNGTSVLTKDITHGYGEICIPTTSGGSTTTHTISAAAGSTTTDTWNAMVTFKNYNNNQNINLDKTFNSNFVFTRI